MSACTCKGEDHPGPNVRTGRGAPEIDILEAENANIAGRLQGEVSQSAQIAPYGETSKLLCNLLRLALEPDDLTLQMMAITGSSPAQPVLSTTQILRNIVSKIHCNCSVKLPKLIRYLVTDAYIGGYLQVCQPTHRAPRL